MRNYIKTILIVFILARSFALSAQGLVPVDTSSSGVYYSDDFESTMNWTTVNYNIDDLWHISQINSSSPTHSLWCGIEAQGNYETGNTIVNAAVSPLIDLTSITSSFLNLEFDENYSTEGGYDQCIVGISNDGGATWNSIRGNPTGSSSGWQHRVYDVSSYLGQTIQIRFYFYTIDNIANNYAGWFVDNVELVGEPQTKLTRNVPTLFIKHDNDLWLNDTTITDYWSTIEPYKLDLLLANFGIDTNLIIDTIYASTSDIQITYPTVDTIPSANGTAMGLAYQPSVAGAVSDTLFIVSNDTASPFEIIFEGEALNALLEPIPEMSYNGQVFGPDNFFNPEQVIDSMIDPNANINVYVDLKLTNKGARPINITNYFFKYGGNNSFWVENWSSTNIQYQDTATITLGFNAQRAKRQVAALAYQFPTREGKITTWSHWVSAQNSFRGTCLESDGPWNSAGPDSLVIDFGSVYVGSSSFKDEIWSKNLGSIPLDINIKVVGDDFSYQGENPIHLNPGQGNDETAEGIWFTPKTAGRNIQGLLIFTHNDTTQGAIDTVYLVGQGLKVPDVAPPPQFTFYHSGQVVNRDSTLSFDLGNALINNDYKKVDFTIVNTGEGGGYFDLENVNNYFYWIDDNGTWWSSQSNIYLSAGDSMNISLAFKPGSGYIYSSTTSIYLKDEYNRIYFNLKGKGLERHAFLVQSNGSNIDEYDNYEVYNYDGYSQETKFTYTNLNEGEITIDSVIITNNDATCTLSAPSAATDLLPGESLDFSTIFDPKIPDKLHKSTIKIYSTNLVEPIYIFNVYNYALGSGEFNIKLVSNNVDFSGGNLDLGSVSSIDGSRTASMRIYSTNGYNVTIDSSVFDNQAGLFSYTGLPDKLVINSSDSSDFTVTYTPRDTSGWNNNHLYMYYLYQDYLSTYTYNYDLYLEGYAVNDRNQAASLSVTADGVEIPNNGTIDFGDSPMNNGIENIILALRNPGVQYVTISSVTFSNPAFSTLDYPNMFDDFEVWYYGPETLPIYFNPSTANVVSGTMTIVSDDPTNPDYVINLQGTGTSGTKEASTESVALYPNPATNVVKVNTASNELSLIKIYNSEGRMILSEYIPDGKLLNISSLDKGFYIVEILTGNKTNALKLTVK